MHALQNRLDAITDAVKVMTSDEVDACRIVETIKATEWKGGEEVEIAPRRYEYRIFFKNGSIYYKPKGRRRYGYRYELRPATLSLELVQKKPVSREVKWQKSIDRAIKMLRASGLWANILAEMETARAVGYEKLQKAYEASDRYPAGMTYEEAHKAQNEAVRAIDERLMAGDHLNTDILWHWVRPLRIKAMNFGRYDNKEKLQAIAEAIKQKKDITETGRTSYDVSFQYKAESNKAWYSEEFKNCGNGHYYLALNATHAVHYEDD